MVGESDIGRGEEGPVMPSDILTQCEADDRFGFKLPILASLIERRKGQGMEAGLTEYMSNIFRVRQARLT